MMEKRCNSPVFVRFLFFKLTFLYINEFVKVKDQGAFQFLSSIALETVRGKSEESHRKDRRKSMI